ncbi:MAG: hypothetical protein AAF739_17740 [Pseudomonadota bacterium]
MDGLSLTPIVATLIFVASCLFGHRYRSVWKAEGPRWKLWLYGSLTAAGFMTLGFIPLSLPT